MTTLIDVVNALKRKRFYLQNEKELQKEMCDHLTPIFSELKKEYILDDKSTIDFFIEGIGIEVKIKGGKMAIYKQCERYCKNDKIKSIILVTNRSMGFPSQINGKDSYLLNIGQAWL